MKKHVYAGILLHFTVNLCLGQTAVMQLTPGTSTRADGDRVLGKPIKKVSETLFEYRPKQSGQKVHVQYSTESGIIDRSRSPLKNLLSVTLCSACWDCVS